MDAPADPAPGTAAGPPRISLLLLGSLAVSALALALPARVGPLGPLVAGFLAFLGYRRIASSGGRLRGPGLARVAMTAALGVLVFQGWTMVRTAPSAAALAEIRGQVARVERELRAGTPEGAFGLLDEGVRREADRAAWVGRMAGAMGRLGALESVRASREAGGDWDRTAGFLDDPAAVLRLRLAVEGTFARGPGTVHLEVVVRRSGSRVTSALTSLSLEAAGE